MADNQISYEAVMSTPFDAIKLGINTRGDALENIDFISPQYDDHRPRTGFVDEVIEQITAYFNNPRYQFSLPLVVQGTLFQKRVWRVLQDIPAGATWHYGKVAQYLATSPRAVGGACRVNPIPVVVPCHRVVACNGLGGVSGQTRGDKLSIKRWLLMHEEE